MVCEFNSACVDREGNKLFRREGATTGALLATSFVHDGRTGDRWPTPVALTRQ